MGTGIGFSKFFFHTKLVLVTGTIGYLYFFFLKKIFHTNLVLILSSRSVFIRLGYGHKISHIQPPSSLAAVESLVWLMISHPSFPCKWGHILSIGGDALNSYHIGRVLATTQCSYQSTSLYTRPTLIYIYTPDRSLLLREEDTWQHATLTTHQQHKTQSPNFFV